jgi:hypothetical protein
MGHYIYHQFIFSHKSAFPMPIFFNAADFLNLEEILNDIYSKKYTYDLLKELPEIL